MKKLEILKDAVSTLLLISKWLPTFRDGVDYNEAKEFIEELVKIWRE